MRPNNNLNISAADASVNQTGVILPAAFVVALSAQVLVTGTSTGTVTIQVSNDETNPTHWTTIPTVGSVTTTGAGIFLIPKLDICYEWVRVSYTATNAASGTLTVNVHTYGF
jgi:hypothetical protein